MFTICSQLPSPPTGKGTTHPTNSVLLPGTWWENRDLVTKPHKGKGGMNPSVENSCATTSSSTLSLTAKICCPWRNSLSSHILRIIISGLKSELWFSTSEEPVLFGPVGPFRVAWSAYMTKQMKTVFIYKSSGTLRAFPFCLIFFHFRTL